MSSGYQDYFKAVRSKQSPTNKKVKKTASAQKARSKSKKRKPMTVDEALKRVEKKRAKRTKKKSSFPVASSLLGLLIAASGLYYYDEVENFLGKVEVSFLGTSNAQGKLATASKALARKSGTNGSDGANNAETSGAAGKGSSRQRSLISDEELSHYSKLRDRKQQLDLREAELNELEEELHKQKKEIEARIRQLEKMREQIAGVLKERVKVDEERVTKLVEFYSNMKPAQAAKIIETLNENLAVEIVGKMKKKNAAAIMNLLEPGKAQMISEKFAGYKRR